MTDLSTPAHDAEFAKPMRELRCLKCHYLLMREYVYRGRIEIKCVNTNQATHKRCNELNRFIFRDYRNGKIKAEPKAQ